MSFSVLVYGLYKSRIDYVIVAVSHIFLFTKQKTDLYMHYLTMSVLSSHIIGSRLESGFISRLAKFLVQNCFWFLDLEKY